MRDRKRLLTIAALIAALCMLAVTIATPLFLEDSEYAEQQTVSAQDLTAQEIVLSGYWDDLTSADVLVMLCPVVGLGWHLSKYYYSNDSGSGSGSGDPDELAKTVRAHESELVYSILHSNVELLENSISGYADIWKFTNSYWMRQAEVAAAERWAADAQDYAPYILERSGLIGNLSQLFENVEEGPDKTFQLINDRLAAWQSSSDYNKMSIVIKYGSNTLSNNSMDIKIRNTISVSSASSNVAYIDARELWVSNGNAVITSEDGTRYTLNSGYNNLAAMNIPEGVYSFASGHTYTGSIVPIVATNAATVHTGIVVESGSDLKFGQYYNNQILIDGTNYTDFTLYADTGDGTSSDSVNLLTVLSMHDALLNAVYESVTKAHVAAQAAWQVYTAAQESNILLSPSSLVPAGMDVTSGELYTLTVLYLAQIADYKERTNANLSKTGFNVSSESLNLYIRGSIYDANGTKIYDSVVFTPYLWLDGMNIIEGSNAFSQSGYIAVWGKSNDLRNWSASSDTPQLVSVSAGYSFDAAQIMHNQSLVSSATLTVQEVEKWNEIEVTPGPSPIVIPKIVDLSPYIAWILIEAAAIWFLVWELFKMDDLLLLLPAVILLLLGLFGADWIAGMIA